MLPCVVDSSCTPARCWDHATDRRQPTSRPAPNGREQRTAGLLIIPMYCILSVAPHNKGVTVVSVLILSIYYGVLPAVVVVTSWFAIRKQYREDDS